VKKFSLYFHGAEVTTHRKLLAAEGVVHIGLNYLYLRPRLESKNAWTVQMNFPPTQSVLVDSGASTVSRKGWNPAILESYMEEYAEFVDHNLDNIDYVVETDFTDTCLGYEWIESQRRHIWDDFIPLEKFIPVWHEQWGDISLRHMISKYPNLGVPPLSEAQQNRLAGLVRSSGVKLHGLCLNHPYDVPNGLYSSVLSTSWISPSKYGETVIWDHNRLRRYDNKQKDQARKRHRNQIIAAGFDPNLFDKPKCNELSRYTIWAWKQMENSMQPPRRIKTIGKKPPSTAQKSPISTTEAREPLRVVPFPDLRQVDIDVADVIGNVSANGSQNRLLPALRDELKVMPGFDFRNVTTIVKSQVEGQPDIEVNTLLPSLTDTSCRKCESCSLAGQCPEFKAGADCVFVFPVQIRTRDQLMGMMNTFLEMQAKRVGFLRMSEEMNGGYPDPNASNEIDRFYKIIYGMKKITEDPSLFKLSIEGQGEAAGQAVGMLSRLFGASATEPLRRVDAQAAEAAVHDAID
jgi:hypothetical protein